MKYLFLGWLLKGKCEVSVLDGLILLAEIAAIFFIVVVCTKYSNPRPTKAGKGRK